MANELAYQTSGYKTPFYQRIAVTRHSLLWAIGICCLFVYAVACVKGWLGYTYLPILSPDGRYAASVASTSPLLTPFVRTYTVQLASYRDRESHVVFERVGVRNNFSIAWHDANKLMIECADCSGSELLQKQVDSIRIELEQ